MEEKTLRILLLEDDKDDAKLIEHILRKDNLSCITECVDTREEYYEALKRFNPDVVLCDHGLPEFDSREALKISLKEKISMPFILVTGTMSDELALSILKEGADDYILKSNLSRLPTAIRRAVNDHKLDKLKREARHALRKHNEELSQTNDKLDHFLRGASYNLRGPLASILGLVNMSKKGIQIHPENINEMISASALKMDEMLHKIVDYSRNMQSEVQCEYIDWGFMIAMVIKKVDHLDQQNKVYKTMQLHTKTPFYSDGARIMIMLSHLFSNAIQYRSGSAADFLRLEVNTTPEHAIIKVMDNGIGIPSHVLPNVSTLFYRGTELSQGAGLGLYLVSEMVMKLNGKLDIQSEPGKGSSVTLIIPNCQEDALPKQP